MGMNMSVFEKKTYERNYQNRESVIKQADSHAAGINIMEDTKGQRPDDGVERVIETETEIIVEQEESLETETLTDHGQAVGEVDEKQEQVSEEELPEDADQFRVWLEEEYSRLKASREELKELQDVFAQEQKLFYDEKKKLEHSMDIDRKRLAQENSFFDQKMKILQSGFEQLETDKRKFEKEKNKFNAKKEVYDESQNFFLRSDMAEMLFRGVNSFLALKKRYKDLIKMYHPDNVAGDHEMVQLINKEYEELKKAYEVGKQA